MLNFLSSLVNDIFSLVQPICGLSYREENFARADFCHNQLVILIWASFTCITLGLVSANFNLCIPVNAVLT